MANDRQCGTCQHKTTDPGHREHYKVGLRNCALLPSWKFVTAKHTCPAWKPATN
jgi:hypothetical protein